MIDLNELKEIIGGLDLPVETLELIAGIDREVEDNTAAAVEVAVAAKDAEWSERYRKSFFSPEAPVIAETVTSVVDDQTTDPEDLSYDDILTEVE